MRWADTLPSAIASGLHHGICTARAVPLGIACEGIDDRSLQDVIAPSQSGRAISGSKRSTNRDTGSTGRLPTPDTFGIRPSLDHTSLRIDRHKDSTRLLVKVKAKIRARDT